MWYCSIRKIKSPSEGAFLIRTSWIFTHLGENHCWRESTHDLNRSVSVDGNHGMAKAYWLSIKSPEEFLAP